MIRLDGYQGFLNTLTIYAMVIMAMGGALIVWAKYNHLRFRGMDRRKGFVAPTIEQLAVLHQQPVTTIEQWQSYSVMTVHHDEHGAIKRVVPDPAARPSGDFKSGRALQGLVEPVVQVN